MTANPVLAGLDLPAPDAAAQPTAPAPSGAELLTRYRSGGASFFASPAGTLLAEGTYSTVPLSPNGNQLADLPGQVAALLADLSNAGHENPIVVGAVPFDHSAPAHLVVPMTVTRSGSLADAPASALAEEPAGFTEFDIHPVPEPAQYAAGVASAVSRLRAGELDKVVLARALQLTSTTPIDVHPLLRRLARRDPSGYTFAIDLPRSRTLVGASPELLVSRTGRAVTSNPLAGSRPRSADPVVDQRNADELLVSAKDRREHAVVVDAVEAALRPFCRSLTVPAEPVLVRTATMWHLSTKVTGELADPTTSALELACALHPTPAVCGTPVALARTMIGELEPFDRGFYTGTVGWGDASGDGEWIVTIRCAEADEHSLRMYAGAGIVADSDPDEELAETSAKFRTLLRAVGIDQL